MSKAISSSGPVGGQGLPSRGDSQSGERRVPGRTLRIAGLLLVAGGLLSLGLDIAGAPEALLRFSYEKLLSGLDVPDEPSATAVGLVRYTALVGGALQVLAGAVVFWVGARRAG